MIICRSQILIYGGETPTPQPYQNTHEDTDTIPDPIYPKKPEPPAAPVADKEIETGYRGYHRNHAHVERETFDDDEDAVFHGHDEKDEYDSSSKSGRSSAVSTGQRTVMIRGLPDRVTHHDITDAVRGGALLDIFLRAREHMASISFVEESAAQEFLHYVKQHGLYVAGKRVSLVAPPCLLLDRMSSDRNSNTGGSAVERAPVLPASVCQDQD